MDTGIVTVALGLLVIAVFVHFVGRGKGSGDSPPTRFPPEWEQPSNCQEAAVAWDNARQLQCAAIADEAAARARAEAIRGQLHAAIAAGISLAAAAAGAAAAAAAATATIFGIPAGIVLWGVAAALGAASLGAFAAADFLGGMLAAAETDVAVKAAARREWDSMVAAGRAAINEACSQDQANNILGRTAPCG